MAQVECQADATDLPVAVNDDATHERRHFECRNRPVLTLLQALVAQRPLRDPGITRFRQQHAARIEYHLALIGARQARDEPWIVVGYKRRGTITAQRRRKYKRFERRKQCFVTLFVAHGHSGLPVPESGQQILRQSTGIRNFRSHRCNRRHAVHIDGYACPIPEEVAEQVVGRPDMARKGTKVDVGIVCHGEFDGIRGQRLDVGFGQQLRIPERQCDYHQ